MTRHLLLIGGLTAVSACDRVVDLISTQDARPYVLDTGGLDGETFPPDAESLPPDGYTGALDTGVLPDAASGPAEASFAAPAAKALPR